ncbi:MAG: beta-galactosidase [Chitinophagaceae bacterium]|nr:beta-galactosidase [Chitinophagaceae bacterium]
MQRKGLLVVLCFFQIVVIAQRVPGKTFYIDAINGDDHHTGLSPAGAWRTLEQVNKHVFQPGERLLFKAGATYEGQLSIKDGGRGVPVGRPVIIDSFGSGYKPRIAAGGMFDAAIDVSNTEFLEVRNLDVSNYGAERKPHRTGILVHIKDFGTARSIHLKNIDVHHVNGSLVKKEGGGAGIVFQNEGQAVPSRFDDISVENCTVKDCERNGILINGYWKRASWFPNLRVVIRKNLLDGVPGDGIVPTGCDSALIEGNVMRNCPRMLPEGEAAAGIWPWSCDNTLVQYNEVSDHKAPWDGQGFDADWNCRNTVIRYNYSHDNEGGFLLVCNDGSAAPPNSCGNTGAIVHGNISVNDGGRRKGRHAGFSPVFHIAGPAVNTRIYNNIIYTPRKVEGQDSTLIEFSNWHGYADSTFFDDNVFYANGAGAGDYVLSKSNHVWFNNNHYFDHHVDRPRDPQAEVRMLLKGTGVPAGRHRFTLSDAAFLLDGRPFQMVSGEMHYTRVPREAWRARMKMAKAMGLNTIGTYVFWNVHEPQKGVFDFSGNYDVRAFVQMAQEEGLWVILRPSPYVCAEWEFGGYPYWLQNEEGLVVRSKEPRYLYEYEQYIKEVGRQLAPLQVNHGGNILMVQIENEYGSYGDDKEYLDINRKMFIEAGFDGLLYTCDPEPAIGGGHLQGLLPAINGVDDPSKVKRLIRENHGGKGPFYIAEWYPAWFDWWGAPHHTVPAERYTGRLDSVLSAGISINMYMFHGGTTRGFMNGANYNDKSPYEPQISSYDYDAPLDEAGNPTDKFRLFREVIGRHLPAGVKLPSVPAAKPAIAIPSIILSEAVSLPDVLPVPVRHISPLTFEDLKQDYGFVLYRSFVEGGRSGVLRVKEVRDYALVMVNGKTAGTLDRRLGQDSLRLQLPAGRVRLEILVENLGRINFGPYLEKNKKGITEKVEFDGDEIKGWEMYGLPFHGLEDLKFGVPGSVEKDAAPVLRRGWFDLPAVGDTYLDMRPWGKGVVWVNGHNLGRYWSVGPQQTLYVPGEWLKKARNEVVVLELIKPEVKELHAVDKPVLNRL